MSPTKNKPCLWVLLKINLDALVSCKNALHYVINGVIRMRYKKICIGLLFIFFLAAAVAKTLNKPYSANIHTELKVNPAVFEAYI